MTSLAEEMNAVLCSGAGERGGLPVHRQYDSIRRARGRAARPVPDFTRRPRVHLGRQRLSLSATRHRRALRRRRATGAGRSRVSRDSSSDDRS